MGNKKKLKHIPLKCKTQKQEEEECKEIRKRENGESTGSQHWFKNWHEQRKHKLTASTFGGAVGFWPCRRVQLWLEKLVFFPCLLLYVYLSAPFHFLFFFLFLITSFNLWVIRLKDILKAQDRKYDPSSF